MSRELSGVTFPASRGAGFIPLSEVMAVVGPWIAVDARWSLHDSEFAPGWSGSDRLDELRRRETLVPTQILLDLVSDGVQLVDGRVEGFRGAANEPFMILRSVRGQDWDVYADDAALTAVRDHFANVTTMPS